MEALPGAEDAVQHAADGAQRHVVPMQGRQWSSLDSGWLGKEDSSCLAIGRGSRKQVLDLVEWKAAIFQLGWTALGNIVHRGADVAQWSKSFVAPPDIRELGTSR